MISLQLETEIQTLEKKEKRLDNEIQQMKSFLKSNNSSFISTVRPKLLASNPARCRGKDGNQTLQKDMRLLKV